MSKSTAPALSEPTPTPAASACGAADSLLRAASECARQHERLGRCLELGCSDDELKHIAELATLADAHLSVTAAAYEPLATVAAREAKDSGWWHAANALWHASREYARRNAGVNQVQRVSGKHSRDKLNELAMEFELEKSALLQLKRAVTDYRAVRPTSE